MRLPRTASGTRRGPLAGASNRQRIAAAAGGPSSGAVPAKSLRRNGTSQQQQQQQPSKAPGQALATAASRGLAAGLAALLLAGSPAPPAAAVLSMPRGQLPRTAEIALRRSIPAYNPDVKAIQDQLEVGDMCCLLAIQYVALLITYYSYSQYSKLSPLDSHAPGGGIDWMCSMPNVLLSY